MDPVLAAQFQADPKRLVGTRWVWVNPSFRRDTQDDVVEVVSIRGRQCQIVTLYSEPFATWTVPVSMLISEWSAFLYVGYGASLDWACKSSYIVCMSDPEDDWRHGAWRIEDIAGARVSLWARPRPSNPSQPGSYRQPRRFSYEEIVNWRAADPEEISIAERWYATPEPPAVFPTFWTGAGGGGGEQQSPVDPWHMAAAVAGSGGTGSNGMGSASFDGINQHLTSEGLSGSDASERPTSRLARLSTGQRED